MHGRKIENKKEITIELIIKLKMRENHFEKYRN